jgi:hypothetical protein
MTRFFAACTTHAVVGCGVVPRIRIRRLACSITASTYIRAPVNVDRLHEVAGQQGIGLGAQEVRPGGEGPFGCRVDSGFLQDLPYGGCGHFHAQHQQFAVQASVAPAGVFPGQTQYQGADGPHGPWPAPALGPGHVRVAVGYQAAVPAQHRVGPHQQAQPAQDVAW